MTAASPVGKPGRGPDRSLTLPSHEYLDRLVAKAGELGVELQKSEIDELWFYYPPERAIAIWEPDLYQQPLGFVLTVLAHELGHVVDFDADPHLVEVTHNLHYSQIPLDIEVSGFVTGYRIIQETGIPLSVEEYLFFIEEPLAHCVRARLTAEDPDEACRDLAPAEELVS
ncbi:MAG: hypothetical protein QME79_05890 [Bacillota bacterium]|nr:hypothetical protein [Bacillota bacterium]